MSRDIYPAMTGASAIWEQMNSISHNLSNVNTNGYKSIRVTFENHMAKAGYLGDSFVKLSEEEIDFSTGSIVQDGVDTHFALNGDGFFVVEAEDGENLVMRAGSFQFNNQGILVNPMGEPVLKSDGGYVQIDQENRAIQLDEEGRIFDQNGDEIGQLFIADSDDLTPLTGGRWRAGELLPASPKTRVIQGALELSNTNPFREMTEMIQTTRMFDSLQKAMQSSNELDGKLNQMTRRSG